MEAQVGVSTIEIGPGISYNLGGQNYEIHKKVGEGGFGSVYKVTDDRGNIHAMKVIRMWEIPPDERIEYSKRLKQEFDIGNKVQSKYIVRTHAMEFVKGNPLMVMDFCPNGNLRDDQNQPQNLDEAITVAVKVLKGLRGLHKEGVIHRDIKPENILLNDEDVPKLADFGISANLKKRMTVKNFRGHARQVFATLAYSAPEQYNPKLAYMQCGATNDIFSFGVLFYELLTRGLLPFGEMQDIGAIDSKKKKHEWGKEKLLAIPGIKQEWVDIIEKCLRFQADERFQSVDEILAILSPASLNESAKDWDGDPNAVWQISIQDGEETGRVYNLGMLLRQKLAEGNSTMELTLGWFDPDNPFGNDIGIVETFTQYVSRGHATLSYDASRNQWEIRDGQERPSTNGTLVNGYKIDRPTKLFPDDILMVGECTMKISVKKA